MSSPSARAAQLAALERRIDTAPPRVQALLREKLAQGRAGLAQEIAPIAVQPARKAPVACEPLALLNRQASARAAQELTSATRFHRSWSRGRAAERVVEAKALRPAQAGPLNSHVLMLDALELMRALSPDYLRRFVAHAETLLWLEGVMASAPQRKTALKRRPSQE